MKIAKISFLLFPLFIFLPQLANAQKFQTMEFDASTSMMLQEFHAMLVLDGDEVKVEMQMGMHDPASEGDKLEQGDVILMMNGKRVTGIDGLRSLYDELEKNTEIKIGVRRGNERFILNALKGNMPENGTKMMLTFDTESDGEQPVIIPNLGFLLSNSDTDVVIEKVIPPMLPDELKALGVEGYTITSFNKEKPSSATALLKKFEALAVGAEITFTFTKDGNEKSITFKKKEPKGTFTMKTIDN
tara:strand:- start:22439 stop:23170 length:732 start_codon:yes stop_codon:yes gene_type:complete